MSSDPPELGKGLFGYRKSAVNQILADRDLMLRQAEGRVRSAESKVADLEGELNSMRSRNTRMDEQLDRLRTQLDALSKRTDLLSPPPPQAAAPPEEAEPVVEDSGAEEEVSYGYELSGPEAAEEAEPGVFETLAAQPEEFAAQSYEGTESEVALEYGEPEVQLGGDDVEVAQPERYSLDDYSYASDESQIGQEQPVSEELYPVAAHDQEAAQASDGYEEPAFETAPYEPSGYEMSGGYEPSTYEAPAIEPEAYQPEAYEPSSYEPAVPEPVAEAQPEEADVPYEPPVVEYAAPEAGYQESAPVAFEEPTPVPPAAPPQPPVSTGSNDATSRMVTEEIAGVLSAAEESANRILERARVQSEQQISKSTRLWEEVRAEVSRLASWREGIEPVIQTVVTKVEGIRSQIEEVPERIREALAPMADSISGIDGDLAELAEACSPPLLLAPSELESEEEGPAGWEASESGPSYAENQEPGHRNAG